MSQQESKPKPGGPQAALFAASRKWPSSWVDHAVAWEVLLSLEVPYLGRLIIYRTWGLLEGSSGEWGLPGVVSQDARSWTLGQQRLGTSDGALLLSPPCDHPLWARVSLFQGAMEIEGKASCTGFDFQVSPMCDPAVIPSLFWASIFLFVKGGCRSQHWGKWVQQTLHQPGMGLEEANERLGWHLTGNGSACTDAVGKGWRVCWWAVFFFSIIHTLIKYWYSLI